MKKIAQGRDRRRQRQLEAAERQVPSTAKRLAASHQRLNLLQADLKRAKQSEQSFLQQAIDRTMREIDKLAQRLEADKERLAALTAGNYPL